MTPGERVVNVALECLGIRERPDGSNDDQGGFITRCQARWGLRRVAWCGCAVDEWYHRAGVDDAGLCHPSTAEMRRRAEAGGAIIPSSARAPAGALWLNDPNHVALIIRDRGDGTVDCVDGNSGNSVRQTRRSKHGARIVVPPAIAAEPDPPKVTEYLLEDPAAQPQLYGPWKSKAHRDAALARLPKRKRATARLLKTRKGRFAFLLGPRRLYGPWATKAARDEAQPVLAKRLGRRLRPFNRKVPA